MRTGRLMLGAACVLLAPGAGAGQTVEVSMSEYRFQPAEVRIKPGDTVKWTNRERRTSHSVHFPGETALESERLFAEESWERTFPTAGRFPYRCGPHPEMEGIVIVAD